MHFTRLLLGTEGSDRLTGTIFSDILVGFGGNDILRGRAGADILLGNGGDDILNGGLGRDILIGGTGDDDLFGGRGADQFLFDPSNDDLGHDVIGDFGTGADQIVLNAADVFRADTGILGADNALQPSDFDDSHAWDLVESHTGNLVVVHPGGTIEVSVGFDASLTFDALVSAGALALTGVVAADEDSELVSQTGDDLLIGAPGAEVFRFDPSNPRLGDDVVVNFTVGEDQIVLNAADVFRADPDILGDDGLFQIQDFDESHAFDLVASERGNLTVVHPGGTIELAGIAFDEGLTFATLIQAGALALDGLQQNTTFAFASQTGDELIIDGTDTPDRFTFDPSNPELGDDIVVGFDVGTDRVVLEAHDILAATPGIEGADGVLQPGDLDHSTAWDLIASDRGNLTVLHPGGSIEFDGISFDDAFTFEALVDGGVIDVV